MVVPPWPIHEKGGEGGELQGKQSMPHVPGGGSLEVGCSHLRDPEAGILATAEPEADGDSMKEGDGVSLVGTVVSMADDEDDGDLDEGQELCQMYDSS
eukprot:6530348-Karenia_brevis.AAC.1